MNLKTQNNLLKEENKLLRGTPGYSLAEQIDNVREYECYKQDVESRIQSMKNTVYAEVGRLKQAQERGEAELKRHYEALLDSKESVIKSKASMLKNYELEKEKARRHCDKENRYEREGSVVKQWDGSQLKARLVDAGYPMDRHGTDPLQRDRSQKRDDNLLCTPKQTATGRGGHNSRFK